MSERAVIVIGVGGHAAVVTATLQDAGFAVDGIYDDEEELWGSQILGVTVCGAIAQAVASSTQDAIIAFGNNSVRQRIAAQLSLRWTIAVHPTAYVHPSVALGPGTVVFAGAIVQPRARIGAHVIVNTGASIDHDCEIGAFSHIGPGSRLCGGVTVGQGALLGVGSAVRPKGRIGEWATVGAGGVVVQAIPPYTTAVGVPARPLTVRDQTTED